MAMSSFVISHDLEAKWEPMHICKHEAICSFTMAELWKSALIQQNKNRPAISWKKKIVLFWKCIIFAIICSIRAKKGW